MVSAPAPIADRTTAVVAGPHSNSAEGNPRRDDDPAARSTSAAVTTRRLGKRYGDFDALIDLSLEVARGEVFGLLGPNGAGKTTFLRTLLGFVRRTSGEAEVLGIDPESDGVGVRRQVAYLPGDARLPRHLRGRSVLRFFADIRPDGDFDKAMGIAEWLELDLRRHVGLMSTGMRQKLAIAAVVATHSPILILDEPTANLDPTVRSRVLDLVTQAKGEGKTVIFSSHVLSEIEEVCDRVVLLKRGRLARQLALTDLRARHRIVAERDLTLGQKLPEVPPELAESVERVTGSGDRLVIETVGDLAPLLGWLSMLRLRQVRAEAFGLRAVYDSVHFSDESRQS